MNSQSLINENESNTHYAKLATKLVRQLTLEERKSLASEQPIILSQHASQAYQQVQDLLQRQNEFSNLVRNALKKDIEDNNSSFQAKKHNSHQPIYTLPKDMLLTVFGYFSVKREAVNCALTSHRFFNITNNSSIIKNLPMCLLNYDEYNSAGNIIHEPNNMRVNHGLMLSNNRLAVCDVWDSKWIKIYDLANNEKLTVLKGHKDQISHLSLFSDGIIMSASCDGSIKLWDSNSYNCTRTLKVELENGISKLEIISDNIIACGSDVGLIRILDLSKNDDNVCIKSFSKYQLPINNLKKLPDNRLACSYYNNFRNSNINDEIIIWDLNKPEFSACIASLKHSYGITSLCLISSTHLASGSLTDNQMKIWDLTNYSCTKTVPMGNKLENVTAIEKLSDNRFICSVQQLIGMGKKCIFKICDTQELKCVSSFNPIGSPLQHCDSLFKISVLTDGKLLIYWENGGEFAIHDFKPLHKKIVDNPVIEKEEPHTKLSPP